MLETLRGLLLPAIAAVLSTFNASSAVAAIAAPENVSVAIVRDVFGKPKSITRSGPYGGSTASATRSYVYDARNRLTTTTHGDASAAITRSYTADELRCHSCLLRRAVRGSSC